eukprot:gnl/TRDRNA2_/TRDRNA2_171272_c1_seq1.p1 gnl/TRDRNA2_/TRDRNA2_171272_c1~~gnl/TRDRNA2_/TRDRNA2_171272_c1_seq1.p1  ORF type:complete len:606 (-),score=72.80 gnl/TRDRNA2_/TRDRNA2_171272_c1_seq1:34-1851(-)
MVVLHVCTVISYVSVLWYARFLRLTGFNPWVSLCRLADIISLRRLVQLFRSACARLRTSRHLEDPFEAKVHEMLAKRRLERAAKYRLFCLNLLLVPTIAFFTSCITFDMFVGRLDEERIKHYVYKVSYPALVQWLVVSVVFATFPRLHTERSQDLVYVLQGVRMVAGISVQTSTSLLIQTFARLSWVQLALSLLCCNIMCTIPVNLVVIAMYSWKYVMLAEEDTLLVAAYLCREVGFMVATSLICYGYEYFLEAEVRGMLSGRSSSQAQSTVLAMLSMLCDAVVHLDPELVIMNAAPQLGAMLFNPGKNYKGTLFADLLIGDDANRFRHYISNALHDSHAQSINVHLRVAGGERVQVRLLHSSFQDFDDKPRYIVGICEMSDYEREGQMKMPDARLPPAQGVTPSVSHGLPRGEAPLIRSLSGSGKSWDALSSGHSDGSGSHDIATSLPSRSTKEFSFDFAVLCDAFTTDLNILKSTVEFALMCGMQPEGKGFLAWVADPVDFKAWVQEHLNDATNPSLPVKSRRRRVAVVSPLAVTLGVELKAECHLSFSALDIEEIEELESLPVKFVFSKVRRNHQRPQEVPSAEGTRERKKHPATRSCGSSH